MQFHNDFKALEGEPDFQVKSLNTAFAALEVGGPVKLRRACPSGVSKIHMEQTLRDGLIHYLSFGFYSQHTIQVWCKPKKFG